ncbi:hypothetical protein K437DRAFT_291790 [Tilletiaria anomala UBC 951]|uniref:Zn(2)-C6 fungal-type domain-containing protein n=1 Tax=Tilletiaria anomala (strain ATCC 24038 / CBS 436.72 / UBC 951) TaxID=1037660 RepID=A0A066VIK5_TILAU|nr:uncharacterized protein K437DRAFT_291790 [Tilletiaria anomala UBC 951]KDN38564.1 hypothetical protein K437DRAFT_291790 [Tilletiaria anomala UBC 951]
MAGSNKAAAATSSGKRAATAVAADVNGSGGKKEQKRRKVSLACVYCRRSHMTCDDSRPCKRCIKRDIGHLCHDRPPAPASASQDGTSWHSEGTRSSGQAAFKIQESAAGKRDSSESTSRLANSPNAGLTGLPASAMPSAFSADTTGPQNLLEFSQQAGTSHGLGTGMMAGVSSEGSGMAPLPLASIGTGPPGFATLSFGPLNFSAAAALSASNGALVGTANSWSSSFRSGLGGASWLGLGGGPTSLGADGMVTQGDSAGGNEFNILSEFLESLDGGASFLSPGAPGAGSFANATNAPSSPYASLPGGDAGANGVKGEGEELVNFDGSTSAADGAMSGADVSADVLNGYSTVQGCEKSGPLKDGQGTTMDANGQRRQQSNVPEGPFPGTSTAGIVTNAPTTAAATSAGQGNSTSASAPAAGPSLNWTSKTERFFLTAADQKDGTRDERLGKVIQAKYEAGLLRPYNHVNGYARLNRWMERNVSPASRRRILKPLSVFRPAFRAVAQSLTNIDLIYIEEAFERLLLDYDRVFSTQGIPACLWRRTGEIYKGNKEFAELVGVQIDALREGRLCIYELMAEESAVNYWEKYGAVSFDPGQKAVLTTCVLKTRNPPRQQKSIPAALAVAAQLPRSTQGSTNGDNTPAAPPISLTNSTLGAGQAQASATATPDAGDPGYNKPVMSDGLLQASSSSGAKKAMNEPKRDSAGFVEIKCCFSFTIRRDQWNIPTMIVGNFLPMNPN